MPDAQPAGSRPGIDPATEIGTVRLTVPDLGRARAFYEQTLGLRGTGLDDGSVALDAGGERPLIELEANSAASPLDRNATGLFHLAVLMPTRLDLGFALARLVAARWPLDGASDHLVSEALYLSDPDGNGIEIYRDRPRDEWRQTNGQLEMATLPLDLQSVAGELKRAPGPQPGAPPGTRIGHVHLQVSELEQSEAFYRGVLGFDVTVRRYPGALFVSAGGYHHHVGLNTWHSAGRAGPAPGAVGLRSFEVLLPGAGELEPVLARIAAAGLSTEASPTETGRLVNDPSGNTILLRSR